MDLVYYYWISTVEGIGLHRIKKIIDFFGCMEDAWHGRASDFRNIGGITDEIIDRIIKRRDFDMLTGEIEAIKSRGISVVSIDGDDYPERLRTIYDPPFILYIKGRIRECAKYIAVVGSRSCTPYGRMASRNISKLLSEYNIGIVSGMARGIDTQAHMGALEGCGYTCAVLGCGCDVVYPPENHKLMDEIEKTGAVISEYPPGTRPSPYNFPARNRIISGLSDAVLVVEAGLKSGALITANYAMEQGRDVFAIPGSIFSSASKGTNSLIRDGAMLVGDIYDILNEFNIEYKGNINNTYNTDTLTAREKTIADAAGDCPIYIDDLMEKVSLKISEINSILTSLELKGIIRVLPGRFVVRII